MVTTRSSTGSLPAVGKPSKKKRRTKQQQQQDDEPPDDSGPTVGDADKFTKLPYEILVMIWSYCQPVDLLQQIVWTTSRENMSVVAQRYWPCYKGSYHQDEDDDYVAGPYDHQAWPRTYTIPPPPPYLNEISWASFIFSDKCSYCQTGAWAIKKYGTYQSACGACTNESLLRETHIHALKREHEKMDVDIRYYSILPHYKFKKSFFRIFWKPTCEMLLREMGEFELSVGLKESAIKEWIVEKRKIVADDGEGKETEKKIEIWSSAHCYSNSLKIDANRKRNTAMFLHCMKDSDHHPDDLVDFCRLFPSDTWLTSDAVIFNVDAARNSLTARADKLYQIRSFRENHEEAQRLKVASTKIMECIKISLARPELDGKSPWGFDYTLHMPDIISLPAIKPVLERLQQSTEEADISELWDSKWTEFCNQMIEIEDEWLEMLLLLVVGEKRSQALDARDYINPFSTVFGCGKCSPKGTGFLHYPQVLDHSCFCKIADSPRFSDDKQSYYPKRSIPLNLSLIYYDIQSSRKTATLSAAVDQAGYPAPTPGTDLHDLPGRFKCLDCPEPERRDMAWYAARNHVCETTYYREIQEDGETEVKSRKHKRLEYIVPQEPGEEEGI